MNRHERPFDLHNSVGHSETSEKNNDKLAFEPILVRLNNLSQGGEMQTSNIVGNIPVNPEIPEGLWSTPHEKRSAEQMALWGKPFILTSPNPHFLSGTRFDVHCLDGRATDRPTCWGMFGTLEEAEQRAEKGPPLNEGATRTGGMEHGR